MPFGLARTQGFNNPAILNFSVSNVRINPKGIFIYSSSTPAFNNLIQSIVFGTVSVLDSVGNLALPGDTTYVLDGSSYQAENRFEGLINWYSAATMAGPWAQGSGIDGRAGEWQIENGGTVQVVTEDVAGVYVNGGLSINFPLQLAQSGVGVTPNGMLALMLHNPETWHAMTLLNSWANVAGFAGAKYRRVASPYNSVEIIGALNAAAATAATFFTLPANYIPQSKQPVCSMGANALVPANLSPWIQCDASGNLSVQNTGAVPAAWQSFFHGFVALDA